MLEVPTVADRDESIDAEGTDLDIHWRTGAWYRTRLRRGFVELGGGIWMSRSCTAVMLELERAPGDAS